MADALDVPVVEPVELEEEDPDREGRAEEQDELPTLAVIIGDEQREGECSHDAENVGEREQATGDRVPPAEARRDDPVHSRRPGGRQRTLSVAPRRRGRSPEAGVRLPDGPIARIQWIPGSR